MRTEKELLEICLEIAENMFNEAEIDHRGYCEVDAFSLKELIAHLHTLN